VPRVAAHTAKLATPVPEPPKSSGSLSKSPAGSRPSTPSRRQQQHGQGNKSGGVKSGYSDSSGNNGGSGLSKQDLEKSMVSLLAHLRKLTGPRGMSDPTCPQSPSEPEPVYTCSLMCQYSHCKQSDFLIGSGANVHIVNCQSRAL
jgi:hypothetical protein